MSENKCPICERTGCHVTLCENYSESTDRLYYSGECQTCGMVYVNRNIVYRDLSNKMIERWDLIGHLRRHSFLREQRDTNLIMPIKTISDLKEGIVMPSSPLEQINLLVEYISCKQRSLSEAAQVDPEIDFPLCFSKNKDEFMFIIEAAYDLELITSDLNKGNPVLRTRDRVVLQRGYLMLSLKGWQKAEELKERSPLSDQVFVAFCFDEEDKMRQIYDEAIKPAVSESGLKPFATIDVDHGDSITDLIIASIRKSRFIIADVTYASQNVYYEAGFAYGLGIPVILTCQKERADEDMKFDTSHIKHIIWKDAKDFKKKLINRIEAEGLVQRK